MAITEDFTKNTDFKKQQPYAGTKNHRLLFVITLLLIGCSLFLSYTLYHQMINKQSTGNTPTTDSLNSTTPQPTPTPPADRSPTPIPLPISKTLPTDYHIFQTYNNCGPAALSMTLRFYGITVSQNELGNALRPYQNPSGDNDDKNVFLDELGQKAKEYGLIPIHRPMGTPELVKQFIALDIPVITRTWTKPTEDIGHFRIIKGYDDETKTFLQDDSLQNKNLSYTYDDFAELWKKFSYEYLVLVPQEKLAFARSILGENDDEHTAWQKAVEFSHDQIAKNPEDMYARFNLSVALYKVGDYKGSVAEFEKIERGLPYRTLWYQIEPILSYYQLGNFDRVTEITDTILSNHNRAFSELYIIRGKMYLTRGDKTAAKREFENAVLYHAYMDEAKTLLNSLN